MAWKQKFLDVQFQLAEGFFDSTQFDTIELTGVAASASITKNGTPTLSQLNLVVRGMTLSQINQLSTLGKPLPDYRNNIVTVTAYEQDGPKTVVFSGTILEAWFDGSGIPDATFTVTGQGALMQKVTPAPPISYSGVTDIGQVMSFLATSMGYNFVNDGVTGIVAHSPYFAGTLLTQAQAVARQYNFQMDIDDVHNIMTIWPKGGVIAGVPTIVSRDTGMVGYPAHTDQGISVTTEFNPNLFFGRAVYVVSALTLSPVSGQNWAVFSLVHELEAGYPEASKWFTTFKANYYGGPTPISG
jgi:hypothetical protein